MYLLRRSFNFDKIRHCIGPDVELRTLGINCGEAFLAVAYDHRDASLYKVVGSDDIVEFLPIDALEDAKYVKQSVFIFYVPLELDNLILFS